ncbi:transposase for insertion sequence element IS21-like domain protein, partial [Bacteroides fragilis str. B1 (UDC16-1)]
MEEFVKKQSSHRKYRLKLENYEQYVRANLEEYPYIS